MIIDIPTPADFYGAGHELLDFAWDTVARFWIDLAEAEDWGVDKEEVSQEYWDAAKGRLASALAITQQGVELILKGKIAQVSPYLLIADPPSKWPQQSARFADFRTVDAQDLVRLFNSVSTEPLPPTFIERFSKLRNSRNRIFHSVDKNLNVATSEVLETILAFDDDFFPGERWFPKRAIFIEHSPGSKLDGGDWARNIACKEAHVVIDMLSPAVVKKYFGIDKGKRLYQCPHCKDEMNSDDDRLFGFAQLAPPEPTTSELYCPICDDKWNVLRQQCIRCDGNVLSDEGQCMKCSAWNEVD